VISLGYNFSSDNGGGYLTATDDRISTDSAVAKQEAVNAEQRKRLEALTARFEEQDKQIRKVSDELQSSKPIQSLARNIP
jgi:predicted phage gp36 major capsid-like protein